MTETHLPEGRLAGELKRTTFQLRLLGREIAHGDVLEVRIGTADPDWRDGCSASGPVTGQGAAGGRCWPSPPPTSRSHSRWRAAALAAGCSVVVKAHPGHAGLSRRTAQVLSRALAEGLGRSFADHHLG